MSAHAQGDQRIVIALGARWDDTNVNVKIRRHNLMHYFRIFPEIAADMGLHRVVIRPAIALGAFLFLGDDLAALLDKI